MILRPKRTDNRGARRSRMLRLEPLQRRAMLNAAPVGDIGDVQVLEDAANEHVDLFAAFEDLEDQDWELGYSITENTNPGLFSTIDIDEYGEAVCGDGYGFDPAYLHMDFAENANGTSNVTVRATDTYGDWGEATFEVEAQAVNDPPVISDFDWTEGPTGVTFTGTVTDVDDDDDPVGWTVVLGGVAQGYTTTVASDGTFTKCVPHTVEDGFASAKTNDGEDDSNLAWCYYA